ncbi:MAG: DUF3465 domain-containing protein [Photobacterium frigidiphilum]|uniref:DUF3465 domain-containing protein n=1 Tax=Photobacterium frigidiphilum TaxID=264736 RepID=UPI003002F1CA
MKVILSICCVVFCLLSFPTMADDVLLKQVYEPHQSDVQVSGSGNVIRVLPDDNQGSRHQKFILRLQSNQTILISHNIDLAPRVFDLNVGDIVEFNGEYEWNSKGGVVHWTHRDPRDIHVHGWLKHNGKTYN